MITDYIEQYLYQPEVSKKVAEAFPQASTGLPEGIEPQGLVEAVYELSKKAYLSRKTNQFVSSSLSNLNEVG